MHPFPPPPPFWETQGGGFALRFLLLLLVMGTVAVVLLRDGHKARRFDIGIWIAAGLVLSAVFIGMPSRVPPAYRSVDQLLYMLWGMVTFGGWITWLKLLNQKEVSGSFTGCAVMSLTAVVLFTVVVPLVSRLGVPPRRIHPCRRNLHDIGIALHNYAELHDESLPPQAAGDPPLSWRVEILPWLDQEDLRRDYVATEAWNSPINLNIARQVVKSYVCPSVHEEFRSRDGLQFTSYAAAVGDHTTWRGDQAVKLNEITDGTSHTLLVVEACGQQIVWTEPRDMDAASTPVAFNLPGDAAGRSPGLFSSYHEGGAFAAFADGHVRYLSADTDPAILNAILTADGGDTVEDF